MRRFILDAGEPKAPEPSNAQQAESSCMNMNHNATLETPTFEEGTTI